MIDVLGIVFILLGFFALLILERCMNSQPMARGAWYWFPVSFLLSWGGGFLIVTGTFQVVSSLVDSNPI